MKFQIKLYKDIEKYSNEDYWGKNSKTILISTKNFSDSDFQELSEKIYYLGILDFVMMHADQQNLILGYNKFQKKTFQTQSRDLARIFPNKLKNLLGYSYKLFFIENPVESLSVKGEFHNGQLYMLQELVKHQNARFHFEKFFPKAQLNEGYNDSYVFLGRYDFGPNLRMRWTLEEPIYPMFTYFTTKFCALAPKKPKRTILSYMETPFDKLTWIMMLISFAIGALIWWIIQKSQFGKSPQSVTHFVFALYGMFFDQDTPMMGLSRSQRCLYQHFVVSLFLLGVLYQSLIVSLIFANRNVQDLNTFDDLRDANIPVFGDENYVNSLNSSGSYKNFLKRLKMYEQFEASLFTKKNPVIFPCILKTSILKDNSFDLSNFYELKDSEFPNYYYYITWYQNPLIEKLKDHFARIFESGLQRIFREKYLKLREEINDNKKRKLVDQELEDFYLEFDDLFGLYNIILYGSLLALFAFILEWVHFLVKQYLRRRETKLRIMLMLPLKFTFFR